MELRGGDAVALIGDGFSNSDLLSAAATDAEYRIFPRYTVQFPPPYITGPSQCVLRIQSCMVV